MPRRGEVVLSRVLSSVIVVVMMSMTGRECSPLGGGCECKLWTGWGCIYRICGGRRNGELSISKRRSDVNGRWRRLSS